MNEEFISESAVGCKQEKYPEKDYMALVEPDLNYIL